MSGTQRTMAMGFAGLAAVLAVAGCSPSKTDFRREAERLINDDDRKQLHDDYQDAACESPTSTQSDTQFSCTAVGSDGVKYTLVATITGKSRFEIVATGIGATS